MKSLKIALLCILAGALLASPLGLTGCMQVPKDPYGVVDSYEANPADPATNNNAFDRASAITLTNDAVVINSVLTTHDVDVYNLGPVAAGDRLVVDADIQNRVLLNAAIGVFDEVGRVYYLNEEPAQTAGTPLTDAKFPAFAPHFEFVARQATQKLFLAVASLPEQVDPSNPTRFDGYTAGPYTLNVALQRGGLAPQPVKQVVALQFSDATVDYPPMEDFGNWSDMPPMPLVGMSAQVLDPAWWRPFIIMGISLQQNQNVNAPFWANFLTFVNATGIAMPNLANITAPQLYGLVNNDYGAALATATANPPAFTPGDPGTVQFQWFANNGFGWLYLFGLYLGPGYTAPAGGGGVGVTTAGLGVWNSILAPGYPLTQDSFYTDFVNVTRSIRSKLQSMYAGLNVEFLIVGEDTIPTDVPVQHLYLVSNANGSGILGLASTIDMGNQDQSDFAVIFGGEYGFNNAWALGVGMPDTLVNPADILNDMGFVCGHELGHTLGLVHTNSTSDVMKRYGGAMQDLSATFSSAPIDSSMFPIGTQDSGLLLLQELGPQP